jgi:hypothetical protein
LTWSSKELDTKLFSESPRSVTTTKRPSRRCTSCRTRCTRRTGISLLALLARLRANLEAAEE